MPVELQIIRASEFVRAGPEGQPDFETSKEFLAKLAAACVHRHIHGALLDLREIQIGPKPKFTPVQLEALVNTFHEVGFSREYRLVVLYDHDPHHRARMFAFISKLQGWNVKAFGSYEEAIRWLALKEDTIQ